jgi:oligosaccharyl transferase (archaeosortase A-associated)
MRRDLILIAAIGAAAFVIRVYPAWEGVLGGARVNFLETDSWYHLRLIENQVRNFPWRVTIDPYAAPGGQFVPIAPLFDTVSAGVVVLLHGRDASTDSIERVAAFMPPILGMLAVMAVWCLGRLSFDRRAALLGAALLAVLPGHFMDRTVLGFVDHHALEALLALLTLVAIAWALRPPSPLDLRPSAALPSAARRGMAANYWPGVVVGIALGLYLLSWASGGFLIGILGIWLLLLIPLARTGADLTIAARVIGTASLVALVLIAVFQDARMHRFASQVIGLSALTALAIAALIASGQTARGRAYTALAGFVVVTLVAGLMISWLAPGVFFQLVTDIGRLAPSPHRMGVLEARPLFLYSGQWDWLQPWLLFRTGFVIGAVAIVLFVRRLSRRHPVDLLVWIFAVVTLIATLGQNRFGYYFVTACALLGGWLATSIIDWGRGGAPEASTSTARWRFPLQRELAVMIVAAAMFGPNLAPTVLLKSRSGILANYWDDTMTWLREHTPPPFASQEVGEAYYFARYPSDHMPPPDYTIMNWWDQGYWLMQRAHRVPVANPTQGRAGNAARFYVETDEQRAVAMLHEEGARFVLADWELPYRTTIEGSIMGRFQSVVDWARGSHDKYYEIYYRRTPDSWTPVWVFHEPYYRSMAYRLVVLGGRAATPANASTVITVADRTDGTGRAFREILTEHTLATHYVATLAAAEGGARTLIVGLDPWRAAFPVEALSSFVELHQARTPDLSPSTTPWVRVFQVAAR